MSYEDKYEQKGKWTYELPCTHKKFSDIDGKKNLLGFVARPVRLQFCVVRRTQRAWACVQRKCLCSRLRLDVVTTHSVVWLLVFSLSFLWSDPPSLLEVWPWRFWHFCGAGFWSTTGRMDFFACNGRWWPWCGGVEGIDGIGCRCHRLQCLLSSRTTFRRGWSIVFYDMSKFCGCWSTLQNLERVRDPFLKAKWEEQVFSPCSKNTVYHPLHSKPHSDYLKKTLVDLNCIYIFEQSSSRAIYRYNFVRVHRCFLK